MADDPTIGRIGHNHHFGFSNPSDAVRHFVLRCIPEAIPTSSPDGWASFKAVTVGLATTIENLIDVVDGLSGDPDEEDGDPAEDDDPGEDNGDDEPDAESEVSLGWTNRTAQVGRDWRGENTEREHDWAEMGEPEDGL
jgi:hypothetical protein